jgi:hypothetical protein
VECESIGTTNAKPLSCRVIKHAAVKASEYSTSKYFLADSLVHEQDYSELASVEPLHHTCSLVADARFFMTAYLVRKPIKPKLSRENFSDGHSQGQTLREGVT